MKYIKKFEILEWQELYKIHFLFYHFLDKIKTKEEGLEFLVTPLYYDTSYQDVKGYIVGFQIKYEDFGGPVTKLLFTIRVTTQNYGQYENKLLIYFDNSKPIDIYTSKDYIWNIVNFLKDKLSKYANEEVLENKVTKYVFDKSEINSLIKELYDDYPIYISTKKFNL